MDHSEVDKLLETFLALLEFEDPRDAADAVCKLDGRTLCETVQWLKRDVEIVASLLLGLSSLR